MHEVVLIAVRNAVSAATRTFTANSTILCFFIHQFIFKTTNFTNYTNYGCAQINSFNSFNS